MISYNYRGPRREGFGRVLVVNKAGLSFLFILAVFIDGLNLCLAKCAPN